MKSDGINLRFADFFCLFLLLGLAIIVIYKAFVLGFTHDESISYGIFKYNQVYLDTANHHLLNSYLMAGFGWLFGNHEFPLRLPNVLSFFLYAFGFWMIIRKRNSDFNAFLLIAILFFNPFLIEMFSIGRGYGLSLGFLIISLYFLIRKNRIHRSLKEWKGDFIGSMVFAALALSANLSTINYYIALLGIYLLFFLPFLKSEKGISKKEIQQYSVLIILSLVPLTLSMIRLFKLKNSNQLYVGEDLAVDSLNSLISRYFYFAEYPDIFKSIWMVIIFIGLGFALFSCFRIIKVKPDLTLMKSTSVLLLVLLGFFLENMIFDAKFPSGRTALYFVLLYGLVIYFAVENLPENNFRWIKNGIISLFVFFMAIHFISQINFNKTVIWDYDADTKHAMSLLEKETRKFPEKKYLSNDWLFEPAINYYIHSDRMNIYPVSRKGILPESDYIYDFIGTPPEGFEIMERYEVSGTYLLRKKRVLEE